MLVIFLIRRLLQKLLRFVDRILSTKTQTQIKKVFGIIIVLTIFFEAGLLFYNKQTISSNESSVSSKQYIGSLQTPAPAVHSIQNIISITNKYRISAGLAPLIESSVLDQTAQTKSDDMVKYRYYEHINPQTGVRGVTTITNIDGKCVYSDENINSDYPSYSDETIVNEFFASKSHREAMLNPNYQRIGVGFAKDYNDLVYTTVHFCGY
jgi:uncharacterized protein YkwD